MRALVTGASSGLGRDFARELSRRGWNLILAARRVPRMEELAKELKTQVRVIGADLSDAGQCEELYRRTCGERVDLLINCAGFGVFGPFDETDLGRELAMIDVDIRALHILTKLFYRDFKRRDSGYLLNVASSAAFQPGPLLAGYYASKAYVLRLTQALAEELRRDRSRVYIGALCPGPVRTEFDEVAGVRFSVRGLSSAYVARYALDRMFRRETVIVPGFLMKAARFAERFLPDAAVVRAAYHMQRRKEDGGERKG